MKRIFYLTCISALGLCSNAVVAQSKEKINPSAVAPSQVDLSYLTQQNYSFVIEIQDTVYSGYSTLGLNPKMIKEVVLEKGAFTLDGFTYDRKIKIKRREAKQFYTVTLDQWLAETVQVEGDVILMINQTVLNVKPHIVLIDKSYILDYEVVVLDQLGFEKTVTVVKLRTKTKENLKTGAYHGVK